MSQFTHNGWGTMVPQVILLASRWNLSWTLPEIKTVFANRSRLSAHDRYLL